MEKKETQENTVKATDQAKVEGVKKSPRKPRARRPPKDAVQTSTMLCNVPSIYSWQKDHCANVYFSQNLTSKDVEVQVGLYECPVAISANLHDHRLSMRVRTPLESFAVTWHIGEPGSADEGKDPMVSVVGVNRHGMAFNYTMSIEQWRKSDERYSADPEEIHPLIGWPVFITRLLVVRIALRLLKHHNDSTGLPTTQLANPTCYSESSKWSGYITLSQNVVTDGYNARPYHCTRDDENNVIRCEIEMPSGGNITAVIGLNEHQRLRIELTDVNNEKSIAEQTVPLFKKQGVVKMCFTFATLNNGSVSVTQDFYNGSVLSRVPLAAGWPVEVDRKMLLSIISYALDFRYAHRLAEVKAVEEANGKKEDKAPKGGPGDVLHRKHVEDDPDLSKTFGKLNEVRKMLGERFKELVDGIGGDMSSNETPKPSGEVLGTELKELTTADLRLMMYKVDNALRMKRVEAARLAIVKNTDRVIRAEYDRLMTELSIGRNVFIDEQLDRLELRLNIDE